MTSPDPPSPADELDVVALERWLDEAGVGSGPIEDVGLIAGGTQNIVYRFRRGEATLVLRRPPLVLRPLNNETIHREATVLTALRNTVIPHPAVLAESGADGPLGVAFYVAEFARGFNPMRVIPDEVANSPIIQRTLGECAAQTAAALGEIDVNRIGLTGLGQGYGWLERQVPRWSAELAQHEQELGANSGSLLSSDAVIRWLERHQPLAQHPGLIHGDFHLGNVLVDAETGSISAVVDWELATIGDPRVDLGQLLATWPDFGVPSLEVTSRPVAHLPGREELIEFYGAASRRDVSSATWFEVLACFRLAVLLEGTHARAHRGHASPRVAARLHATAETLIRRAEVRIAAE